MPLHMKEFEPQAGPVGRPGGTPCPDRTVCIVRKKPVAFAPVTFRKKQVPPVCIYQFLTVRRETGVVRQDITESSRCSSYRRHKPKWIFSDDIAFAHKQLGTAR